MPFISVIFGFRNRDAVRVKRCLDSLAQQTDRDFEVNFIDYGSDKIVAEEISALCSHYDFVNYHYSHVQGRPWNRAHSLNTGVRLAKGKFVLMGDIDLIYSKDFIAAARAQADDKKNLYGNVVLLDEHFSDWNALQNADEKFLSAFEKTTRAGKGAVHILSRAALEKIGGYDEFYCFWGVEDRDLSKRLAMLGLEEQWMEPQPPVFHQWHPAASDFYNSGFPMQWWEEMNFHFERMHSEMVRNANGWGKLFGPNDRPALDETKNKREVALDMKEKFPIAMSKASVIAKIYGELRTLNGERISFTLKKHHATETDEFFSAPYKLMQSGFLSEKKFRTLTAGYKKYRYRMNYFIPSEDLTYIFWNIARHESALDYFFSENEQQFEWRFARLSSAQ